MTPMLTYMVVELLQSQSVVEVLPSVLAGQLEWRLEFKIFSTWDTQKNFTNSKFNCHISITPTFNCLPEVW